MVIINCEKALLLNMDKIHTTDMGIDRIKNNLRIDSDVIIYCKNIILNKESNVYRKGKNYYVENGNKIITINAYSYTIITAHMIKEN